MRSVAVGEISEQIRGVSYGKGDATTTPADGYAPVLRAGNITEFGVTFEDLVYVPKRFVSEKQLLRSGDVLIAASSGSLDVVGKAAPVMYDYEGAFGAFCKVLRPRKSHVEPSYFAHYFKTPEYRRKVSSLAAGANINNLKNEHLDELLIPLPPLEEQRRIAAILDKADSLRAKRREALAQLDRLAQSIFVEMFGDPATNPKGWPWRPLGSLAKKFSDGPFGSNLKSEHYVESGVRVVRLQNIGVGDFIDNDKAYISEEHFERIAKHECIPGDILVGTLGDPNLRACSLPSSIPLAINKADCVQIRVDEKDSHAAFVCALLNHPSTEALAQSLMHGQTRVRISMGSLRELKVPVPPLALQRDFAERVGGLGLLKKTQTKSAIELNTLFGTLQQRAFAGEL